MPFVEHQPGPPAKKPKSPTLLNSLPGLLLLPIILPALVFTAPFMLFPSLARLLFGARTTRAESDGWLAEWVTPRFLVCHYCSAQVRRLELHGTPYPLPPAWKTGRDLLDALATPAGAFMVCKRRWRRAHWELPEVVTRGDFDDADQSRGWYATEYVPPDNAADANELNRRRFFNPAVPVFRKAGTPATWCLLHTETPRWVDPHRLDEMLAIAPESDEAKA